MSRNVLTKNKLHIKATFAVFVCTVDKVCLLLTSMQHGNDLSGVTLGTVTQLHGGDKGVFWQQVCPDGVTGEVSITGIVDMTVYINIGINGMICADKFFALKVTNCGRKIHWDSKIFIIRNQLSDISGRKHFASGQIQ